MSGILENLKAWFGRRAEDVRDAAEGGTAIATPAADFDRETSTNAQVAGAADEPYPGND
jgi:hypothetical protein